jgi:D-proline reductase (dithiol) PrdB
VSALSYYLEREGIMTTGISLVRENTQSMQPPRSLWVTFPMGRPLGKPGDPAFQHRVIFAALELLNCDSGPVLIDYPEDSPSIDVNSAPACPVFFPRTEVEAGTWTSKLIGELETLRPWHDLGRRRRGRSLVGISQVPLTENLIKLGNLLDEDRLPVTELDWFKHAIEDAKVFYLEALTAQPGEYNHQQINDLLWQETVLGGALLRYHEMFSADEQLRPFARIVAPREAIEKSARKSLKRGVKHD